MSDCFFHKLVREHVKDKGSEWNQIPSTQVIGYDKLVYNPLQVCLSPVVTVLPRHVTLGGTKVTVFTANGVSLARTALVVPVACCLR